MKSARVLALALLIGLCWASVLWCDYKESFRRGVKAFDHKEWGEAARWMQQATSEQPKEGESIKFDSGFWETYTPYYYLGLSLFHNNNGDCKAALSPWQESEKQGKVQTTLLYKDTMQFRNTCIKRTPIDVAPSGPDPLAQAAQAADSEIQRAAEVQAELAKRNVPKYAEAWKQEFVQAGEAQWNEQVGRARTLLERGKADKRLSDLQEAEQLASQARQNLKALLDRLEQRQVALFSEGNPGQGAPLQGGGGDVPPAGAPKGQSSGGSSTTPRPPETSDPPKELHDAAQAFFRADYQEVVRKLAEKKFTERRARLAGNLLLAAARYSQYLLGGEKDARLREEALKGVRACRALNPNLKLDKTAFSPRFVEFFETAK